MTVVDVTLDAMETHPRHQQLQKNTLLTLCSDKILQEIEFDRYRCARLVLECLCQFDDASMNRWDSCLGCVESVHLILITVDLLFILM